VAQEYELFLHEHVENTRAARMAATAPSHAQWAAIIRQQNALHRQLQQKIRLLAEMQEKRKREEERFLDDYEASLGRNPSDAPRGGRQASNRKKILNRGNEPKNLLNTQELANTTPSKRTPFCPGKPAIKAKKRAFQCKKLKAQAIHPLLAASPRIGAVGAGPIYETWAGASRSHSRESGNLLGKPSKMRCRRTGFPLSRE
jgi:hypothetical protein